MITHECTYLGFCHTQYMHTCKQKKHTRARKSSSPMLLSVLKVRFRGEINLALLSAPISIILIFHKIIKARFTGFKSHINAHLSSPLREPSESLPTTCLKVYFVGFQKRCKILLSRFSNFVL